MAVSCLCRIPTNTHPHPPTIWLHFYPHHHLLTPPSQPPQPPIPHPRGALPLLQLLQSILQPPAPMPADANRSPLFTDTMLWCTSIRFWLAFAFLLTFKHVLLPPGSGHMKVLSQLWVHDYINVIGNMLNVSTGGSANIYIPRPRPLGLFQRLALALRACKW